MCSCSLSTLLKDLPSWSLGPASSIRQDSNSQSKRHTLYYQLSRVLMQASKSGRQCTFNDIAGPQSGLEWLNKCLLRWSSEMLNFYININMSRKCGKCLQSEDILSAQFIDLLEDSEKKCQAKICQKCIKSNKTCECQRRINQHRHSFKHRSIIDFTNEQTERKALVDKYKHMPRLLIEIVVENMRNHKFQDADQARNVARQYEDRKRRKQYTFQGRTSSKEKQLPKWLGSNREGDGKEPSGYRNDWQKGIHQIIMAFNTGSPTWV